MTSIDIRVAGWAARGLRCPDHEVSMVSTQGSVFPISLIQMPNGTGKTTTLTLLRAALSNGPEREAWDEDHVRSFRKLGSDTSRGLFKVDLLYNGSRLTFSLDFDFEGGRVETSTTISSGLKRGFHPPRPIERFLRAEFVNFFVFDGELAEHLISAKHSDAETAIDDLFQLQTFNVLQARVQEYWEGAVTGRGALEEKGLTRRANRVRRLRNRISELEERRSGLEDDLNRTTERLENLENDFEDSLKEREEQQKRLREAGDNLTRIGNETRDQIGHIVGRLKNPVYFSDIILDRLIDFRDSLDKAKLPESAAREFFAELAQQSTCICGRPLSDETRKALRERAHAYLGSDDVALLNAMKGRIADEQSATSSRIDSTLDDDIERLKRLLTEETRLRTERDRIESDAAAGDPELERTAETIRQLREEKLRLEYELKRFDDPTDTAVDEDTVGLTVLRRRLTEAEKMLSEVTHTMELKEKRDVILGILADAYNASKEAIGAAITRETNERIVELMPHNNIRVARIGRSLELEGKESGSTGENLSVAYAFLSTLFSRSDHSLPFVVDSPAGPIDLKVREQIAPLIPQLAKQFVAFTISSERAGFVDPLQRECEHIQYLTMFRKGDSKLKEAALETGEAVESDDGLLVRGTEFFRRFHLDEET